MNGANLNNTQAGTGTTGPGASTSNPNPNAQARHINSNPNARVARPPPAGPVPLVPSPLGPGPSPAPAVAPGPIPSAPAPPIPLNSNLQTHIYPHPSQYGHSHPHPHLHPLPHPQHQHQHQHPHPQPGPHPHQHQHPHPHPHPHQHQHPHPHSHPPSRANGVQKGKKKVETPIDPATVYESVKNRIATLEEEEVFEEEEARQFSEEAQSSVKGLEEKAIHTKYIELFAEHKRMERNHAKEKQKLIKDKDAAKGQLTKANQTKTKMESLARELQKDNKRLREDSKRLAQCVEEAQDEIQQMKLDISKRAEKAKTQEIKFRELPDIVVKVVCRYRAELFFKISRKTKLSRLFNAWTERMEAGGGKKGATTTTMNSGADTVGGDGMKETNGMAKMDGATSANANTGSPNASGAGVSSLSMQFVFTHNGRSVDAELTPEEAGMEDGDEILAVELMDLTEGGAASQEWNDLIEPRRQKLKKNWTDNPNEAKKTMEEIFDGVVRERLKEVLRQYELRERHFECVIRSKELEVLLSRARAAEQKQLAEGEKARSERTGEENRKLTIDLEEAQKERAMVIDKLTTSCKEPNIERTQQSLISLLEELQRGGTKFPDGPVGG